MNYSQFWKLCHKQNQPIIKKVKCLNNDIIYNSIRETARELGLAVHNHISEVCRGKAKQYKGFVFE